MPKVCDHKCSGMLVWKNEKLLLIERKRFPLAFAPPAGHCDGDDFVETAKKELLEEVGLEIYEMKLLIEGRKENHCRREDGIWHYWQIFEVKAKGDVVGSQEETKQTKWADKNELRNLAARTEEFQAGKISQADWDKNPGLEEVWYDWMKELKII